MEKEWETYCVHGISQPEKPAKSGHIDVYISDKMSLGDQTMSDVCSRHSLEHLIDLGLSKNEIKTGFVFEAIAKIHKGPKREKRVIKKARRVATTVTQVQSVQPTFQDVSESYPVSGILSKLEAHLTKQMSQTGLKLLISKLEKNLEAAQNIIWRNGLPTIVVPTKFVSLAHEAASQKVHAKNNRGTDGGVQDSFKGNIAELGAWILLEAIRATNEPSATLTFPDFSVHPKGDILDMKLNGHALQVKWRQPQNLEYFLSSCGDPSRDFKPGQENDYFILCSGADPINGQSYNLNICKFFHGKTEISLMSFVQQTFGILK